MKRTGKLESCLAGVVGSWPLATSGKPVMSVQFPMHDIVYGRRPAGEVQLLASTIYDERAISPAFLKGDWLVRHAASVTARMGTDSRISWSDQR